MTVAHTQEKGKTYNLELNTLSIELNGANLEVNANGGDEGRRPCVVAETEEET